MELEAVYYKGVFGETEGPTSRECDMEEWGDFIASWLEVSWGQAIAGRAHCNVPIFLASRWSSLPWHPLKAKWRNKENLSKLITYKVIK